MTAAMLARAWLNAVAFVLNGGVLLVGLARLQSRLAPQDYVFVGLLLAAPVVSASALVLGYRKRVDPQVSATVRAAAILLNVLLLVFVCWLTVHLDPDTRMDEALWLLLLYTAPPTNGLALSASRSKAVETGGA
jgi:drug/metabolite transporter (DMT)-like permease